MYYRNPKIAENTSRREVRLRSQVPSTFGPPDAFGRRPMFSATPKSMAPDFLPAALGFPDAEPIDLTPGAADA